MSRWKRLFATLTSGKGPLWTVVLCCPVFTAAFLWWPNGAQGPWGTSSGEAQRELEAGLVAWTKAYHREALDRFTAASALDPAFAAPKALMLDLVSPGDEARDRLTSELAEVDTLRLPPRERFLVDHALARAGVSAEDPSQVVEAFLETHPDDPFGLRASCDEQWSLQHWDEAEACYARLLEQNPSWAMALRRLGHIAMHRGYFKDAKNHFLTYRYMAPDQAAPYLSLGQLLILLGRYDEASEAIDGAILIEPDLCAAHLHRIRLLRYTDRVAEARRTLARLRAEPFCATEAETGQLCAMEAWIDYQVGDFEAARTALDGVCLKRRQGFDLLAHRLAVMDGRFEDGRAMETALHNHFEEVAAAELSVHVSFYAAVQLHMEGVRELAVGDYSDAAARFQAVDERLGYWGGDRSGFKLFNRLNWLRVLEWQGKHLDAQALRREIDQVNPKVVESFPLTDLDRYAELRDSQLASLGHGLHGPSVHEAP